MITASVAYGNAIRDLDRTLTAVSRDPQVARETAHYLDNIGNVKSIDDFMGNRRLLRYALTAHGLSDLNYATAFIRKLLEGGVDDSQALANRLSDQRYRDFVTTFNFSRYGTGTTAFDRTQKGTTDLYTRQILEQNTGSLNEGARMALYFQRKAATIASPLNVLADAALLKVVQTAAGLPVFMSNLSLDAQIELIASKVDVADFKDPDKLQKFLTRFTVLWDVNNPSTTPSTGFAFSTSGFSPEILTAIQRTKNRL